MLLQTFQSQPFTYRLPADISSGAQLYHPELTAPPRIYGEEYDGGGVTAIFLNEEDLVDGYEVVYLWITQNMVFFPGYNYTLYRFNATTGEYLSRIGTEATLFIFSKFAQARDGTIWRCDVTNKIFKITVDPVLGVSSDGVVQHDLSTFSGLTSINAFSIDAPQNVLLAGVNVENSLRVYNLTSGALLRTITLPGFAMQIMPEDLDRCYVMASNGVMCLVNYSLGVVLSAFKLQSSFDPFTPGNTFTWDRKYRRFLAWIYTPVDRTGQNTSVITGYFPQPQPVGITKPIPLKPPRRFRSVPILTRIYGDMGEAVGGERVVLTSSDITLATISGFPSMTDADGESIGTMTDLAEGDVTITARADDGISLLGGTGGTGGGTGGTGGGTGGTGGSTFSGAPVPGLPFDMPDLATMFGSTKQVFAHYFYTFPLSIDNVASAVDYYNTQFLTIGGESGAHAAYGGYLRQRPLAVAVGDPATFKLFNMQAEIRLAMARGITAFAIDILNLADALSPTGHLQTLLAASASVDTRFQIMPMLDMASLGAISTTDAASIIQAVAGNASLFTLTSGEILFSAFEANLQNVTWWTSMIGILTGAGIATKFIPVLLGGASDAGTLDPVSYGVGAWGTAIPSAAAGLVTAPATAHGHGLKYMLPILPQQFRPKNQQYWEAGNSSTFRNSWESAISGGADYVQVVTWSDFSESGQVEPYTDATLNPDIGTGFYDLNAYYAAWYLTGVAPVINADRLYWFHRRMPLNAAHPNQANAFTCSGGTPSDLIEVVSFLTAPGTVSISVGTSTTSFSAPAGLSSHTAPLTAGTPIFRLSRGGSDVISGVGPVQIFGTGGDPAGTLDFTYWSGSIATVIAPLTITPDVDFPDALEGAPYSEIKRASGGTAPYFWAITGVPSWATATISTDTTQLTIHGTAPAFTQMNTINVTLTDSTP